MAESKFPSRRAVSMAALTAGLLLRPPLADASTAAISSAALNAARSKDGIPAASAAVARGGRLLWTEAVGLADLELAVPATPASRFRIGSVSKALTATLAMRLAEMRAVDLEAPASNHLSGLPTPLRSATLLHLLTHQSGVRHYIPRDSDVNASGGPIDLRTYRSTEDILAIFVNDPLVHAPGAGHTYSTFGYTLAGVLLERATGRPFLDLLRAELAAPLGLDSIGADRIWDIEADRVRPYEPAANYRNRLPTADSSVINAPWVNAAYKRPGGGLIASAGDLARFGSALLRPGYLGEASRRQLFTPWLPPSATGARYALGLGWRIDQDEAGRRRYHHSGGIEGGRASLVIYPDFDLAAAFTSNLGSRPGDPLPIIGQIAAGYLGARTGSST